MNKTRWKIAFIGVLALSAQVLIGCGDSLSMYEFTPTPAVFRPTPVPNELAYPAPAYSDAQATIDSSQKQLLDLARKATEENQKASATEDASLKATQVAAIVNLTQAAATQEIIAQQTKIAQEATAAAQNGAATATSSANWLIATQTAQAISILGAQITQTAQAEAALAAYSATATRAAQSQNASATAQTRALLEAQAAQTVQAQLTLTAFPLTATPLAATNAVLMVQEYKREQQTFDDQVVDPLKPVLAILFVLSISIGIVYVYRRVGTSNRFRITDPVSRYRRPLLFDDPIRRRNMIDGVISDPDARFRRKNALKLTPADPPGGPDSTVHVEIVDASDPSIADWISEVERRLAGEGGQKH